MDSILLCQHCGNKSTHNIISKRHETEIFQIDEIGEVEYSNSIWFVQCRSCLKHSLFSCLDDNEVDSSSLWPTEKRIAEIVPNEIKIALDEAYKVKRISQIAFVVLIRRALEILCKHENASGNDLYIMIESLGEKGVIPNTLIEMANLIRLLGNAGVHSNKNKFQDYEVDILDEFFQAIIEYVYIAPAKVNKLRDRIKR